MAEHCTVPRSSSPEVEIHKVQTTVLYCTKDFCRTYGSYFSYLWLMGKAWWRLAAAYMACVAAEAPPGTPPGAPAPVGAPPPTPSWRTSGRADMADGGGGGDNR